MRYRSVCKKYHRLPCLLLALLMVLAAAPLPGFFSYAETDADETLFIPEEAEQTYGEGYLVKLNEESGGGDVLLVEDAEQIREMDPSEIDYVEVNHPVTLTAAAEDPYYEEQYYLERTEVPAVWDLGLEEQQVETAADPVVVAVIDSGLYTGHEDIDASRVLPGKYFGADGVTDDTTDENGHGTQVTGILMATKDNGTGIAGVSQGVLVMPLKVADRDGRSTEKQVIEALQYAAAQKRAYDADPSQGANIQVINMSLEVTMAEGEEAPQALKEACCEAMDAGILIVCAAGNEEGTKATYPAQYTMGVGATEVSGTGEDVHAACSRVLSAENGDGFENKVWVCAPGSGLIVPTTGGEQAYTTVSGTSFAAPQVAALAAFCKYVDPAIQQETFKGVLRESAASLQGGQGMIGDQDIENGYGLVNDRAALAMLGVGFESAPEAVADSTETEPDGQPVVSDTTDPMPEEEPVIACPDPEQDPESPQNRQLTDKTTPADTQAAAAESLRGAVSLQSSSYMFGIDVSYWDGETIDWKKVRNAGVRFVIIRVGYAALASGTLNSDYMYAKNIKGAYNAGINVGVYIYSQATTNAEAKAEAEFVIQKIEPYRSYISLPVVMDMESPMTFGSSNQKTHWAKGNVSKAQVASNYKTFSNTIRDAGYVPMFYTYTSWITEHVGSYMSRITGTGDPFWLAEYPSSVGTQPPLFSKLYSALYAYDFWQYSDTGKISGISTSVDLNRWYTTDLFKFDRRGRWEKEPAGWRYYNADDELVVSGFGHDTHGWAWLNEEGYFEECTGWVESEGEWYYVIDGYRQQNRWLKDSTGWCYAGEDGKLIRNGFGRDSQGWGWLNADGYFEAYTGWVESDDDWYYVVEGYRQANAWFRDNRDWCYVGSDGRLLRNGWAKDSIGWCWMGSSGYRVMDKWIKDDGDWYYIKANGYMAANRWMQDSKGWLWLLGSGKAARNRWIRYKGSWYYLKSNCYMAANEWAKDSKGWLWMNGSGRIVRSRWITYGNNWYYLKSNGYMAANEWARDGKGWMWMNSSGRITKSKWIKYKGYWYYLKANGYMATGSQTINGKVYRFNSSGRWIE